MSHNLKFYIAIFELLAFSIFMVSLDIIIIQSKSFDIPFFKDIDAFPLYGMNYISLSSLIVAYKCIKVHGLVKQHEHSHIVQMLEKSIRQKNCDDASQESNLLQKNATYYLWITNKKCQTALHAFTLCGVLVGMVFLWNAPDFLGVLAGGFFIWGVVSLFRGTMEIV